MSKFWTWYTHHPIQPPPSNSFALHKCRTTHTNGDKISVKKISSRKYTLVGTATVAPVWNTICAESRYQHSRLLWDSAATWAQSSLSFTTFCWDWLITKYFKSHFLLYWLPSYHFQSTKTACVQRQRPLSLITHLLWTFWHTQGDSEILRPESGAGCRQPHYQPAGHLCPLLLHSSPHATPSSNSPPIQNIITLCCLVPISE